MRSAHAHAHPCVRTRPPCVLVPCAQALGPAAARARLLESKGYKAVLVSAVDWAGLADHKAKAKFLLAAVQKAVPGASSKVGRGAAGGREGVGGGGRGWEQCSAASCGGGAVLVCACLVYRVARPRSSWGWLQPAACPPLAAGQHAPGQAGRAV